MSEMKNQPYVMLKPFQVFHPELAKVMREHAGEKCRPSNGTEGDIFMGEWCTAFVPYGEELPPVRCEKTIDMFEGATA